jgi:hypothetical protein
VRIATVEQDTRYSELHGTILDRKKETQPMNSWKHEEQTPAVSDIIECHSRTRCSENGV